MSLLMCGKANIRSSDLILNLLKHITMNGVNLSLILTFSFMIVVSEAIKSSKLNNTQQHLQMDEKGCSYLVIIKTSCSSPFNIAIGEMDIVFGDAHGNQIYVPHLDGAFEDCSAHTYEIYAPCIFQICRVYLYWIGDAAWILDTLIIHNYLYLPVTFYYNTYIPNGGPYGFDYCN
ncbi:hypothetical protein VNO78_14512 [Psophocarpus tetragonolobus]|uniref:Uncharacterized protein n=1 Tax=Psophocarpus tetragonolobus TaxID=3891 RepID=A0AAN9SZZ2_PSOTE